MKVKDELKMYDSGVIVLFLISGFILMLDTSMFKEERIGLLGLASASDLVCWFMAKGVTIGKVLE